MKYVMTCIAAMLMMVNTASADVVSEPALNDATCYSVAHLYYLNTGDVYARNLSKMFLDQFEEETGFAMTEEDQELIVANTAMFMNNDQHTMFMGLALCMNLHLN